MSEATDRCRRYRRRILEVSRQVSAAHVAPAFSCLEIVDALYHEVMRPDDIFIMSKGHGYLAQCVVLEDMGRLPMGSLRTYCKADGKFGAHPDYNSAAGIHASTGSLGHGLGIAAGQALAERMKGSTAKVYVLLSDGECQEGSTWEAAMVAANLGLVNLVALVDSNGWGGMDEMSDVHPALAPIWQKFKAFGWAATYPVNGHDPQAIVTAKTALWGSSAPRAIECQTVKGKGVSFMEDVPIWHYRSPNDAEYKQAMEELA